MKKTGLREGDVQALWVWGASGQERSLPHSCFLGATGSLQGIRQSELYEIWATL